MIGDYDSRIRPGMIVRGRTGWNPLLLLVLSGGSQLVLNETFYPVGSVVHVPSWMMAKYFRDELR